MYTIWYCDTECWMKSLTGLSSSLLHSAKLICSSWNFKDVETKLYMLTDIQRSNLFDHFQLTNYVHLFSTGTCRPLIIVKCLDKILPRYFFQYFWLVIKSVFTIIVSSTSLVVFLSCMLRKRNSNRSESAYSRFRLSYFYLISLLHKVYFNLTGLKLKNS